MNNSNIKHFLTDEDVTTNFEKMFPNIDPELWWSPTSEELHQEFFWYLDHPRGQLTLNCNRNKIVKAFQQDNYFCVEKTMWYDLDIRKKILENRMYYLNKTPDQLNTYDILSGFKKSAIYYGYGGFNPQLCKWVYQWIQDNVGINMKQMIVFDPCGGWGHRMIGSTEIKKYIYNDLSYHTYDKVDSIKSYFDFWNAELHNEDARSYTPQEDFNVMFTCPPYYNLEIYECGRFTCTDEFDEFLTCLYNKFLAKDSCMVYALVMREDLMKSQPTPQYSFKLSKNRSVHINNKTPHKHDEYLYIYVK